MPSSSLFEVYLEIGKVQDTAEKVLICQVPETFAREDPSEANILKRLQEFSFSAPNPVVKDSDNRRFVAVQYTYVLQECVNIKSADCDITTLSHYVFCLQREDGLTTHCISSLYPFFRSFYKLLSVISTASKEGKDAAIQKLLLAIAKENRLPAPGNPVTIHLPPSYGIPGVSIEHESPFCLPLMYENDHVAEFYRAFGLLQSFDPSLRRGASTLVRIFAHLLMERRFLVTSNEVRRFTSCCYALQTIMYPLQWEFTFVPLLFPDPRIIDMVGLPQPYIMGIHKSHLEDALKISDNSEDCAIVLDVDTGNISPHYADDVDILPKEVRLLLESRLSNSEMISRKGDYFCRIFMDALVLLIGDYSQFFLPNVNSNSVEFSWPKYQNYRPEGDYRKFALAVESKLGMIKMFILSRLEMVRQGRPIPFDDFERSLKDRPVIVKECRGNAVQHRIKHGAGKLMGGFKNLMQPRSHSRPILEHSGHSGSSLRGSEGEIERPVEKLRRPLSQEDLSYPVEISLPLPRNELTVKESALPLPPPVAKKVELEFQQPAPLPTITKSKEYDLIHLDSSSDEADSCDEEVGNAISVRRSLPPDVLEKNDPLALFDPLEAKKRSSSILQPTSKSRSNSVQQQQRELIDRVLALYAASPTPQPIPGHMVSAPSLERRQSMLFPGRIPIHQFQQQQQQQQQFHPMNFYPPVPQLMTQTFPYQQPMQLFSQPMSSVSLPLPAGPPPAQQLRTPPVPPPRPPPDVISDRLSKWTRFDD